MKARLTNALSSRIQMGHYLRAAMRGSIWTLLVQITAKVSSLLVSILGARALRVDAFGAFSVFQVMALTMPVLWDFGTSGSLQRALAGGEVTRSQALRQGVQARVALLPLLIVGWLLAGFLTSGSSPGVALLPLLATASVATGISALLSGLLGAQFQFGRAAIAVIAARFSATLALISFAVVGTGTASVVAGCYLGGELLGLALLLATGARALPWRDAFRMARRDSTPVRFTLCKALPYALGGLLQIVYSKFDLLLVLLLAGPGQAAFYTPATRLQDGLAVLPAIATAALIPVAAARVRFEGGQEALGRAMNRAFGICLTITAPAVIFLVLVADPVVAFLYGSRFGASGLTIRIIAVSVLFTAYTAPAIAIMVARGQIWPAVRIQGWTLGVAVVGHVILDPGLGANGAALTSVIRDAFMTLLCARGLRAGMKYKSQAESYLGASLGGGKT